jgi:membrane-bound hydrogenase subunit beta
MSGLEREEGIRDALVASFPFLEGGFKIQRERRIRVEVDLERFREVFDRAADGLGFSILCILTGLDEGEGIGLVYHLADESGAVLGIHTRVPKSAPVFATITDRFPAAHIYEREIVDLLGAEVLGLPPGNRYPLPDDWPEGQYPLRKDWVPPVEPDEAAAAKPGEAAACGEED